MAESCAIRAMDIHPHEMESPDQHVGVQPVADIQNTLVRASAHNDTLAVNAQTQVLLVQELVLMHLFSENGEHAGSTALVGSRQAIACTERHFLIDIQGILNQDYLPVILQGGIHAYVAAIFRHVCFEGMPVDVHGRGVVHCEECMQASRVVIVSMRDNGQICTAKVDAEPFRIAGESFALACIKKDAVFRCFDEETQAMFGLYI